LAASILTAGGIDTVLLLFEQEEHMAIGINLPHEPRDARTNVYYYTYENERYYIAECTGNFRRGWRVGECPDMVQGSQAVIIPLDNMELAALSKVSSSYSTQQQSSLILSVPSRFIIAQNEIKITGKLNPTLSNKNITLYASSLGSQLTKIGRVKTDSQGTYIYIWESPPGGLYQIRANWDGDTEYAGSDSNISQLVIIPFLWVTMAAIVLFFLIILIIVSLANRGNKIQRMEELEKQEDWDFTE
jgi:hypothetical protein